MADLEHLLKRYRCDRAKETEGVWHTVALGPGQSLDVRVARTTNAAYRDRLLTLIMPLLGRAERDADSVDDDEIGAAWAETMAGTLLTDWRTLKFGGKEVPFSEEAAVVVLTELPEFREEIMTLARKRDRFIADDLDAVAERLGKTLSGSSAGGAPPATRRSKKG